MALTAEETIKYKAKLTKAEDAYERLMISGSVRVFVDQNSERIEYSATNKAGLLEWINYLRNLLGLSPFLPQRVLPPAGVLM